MKTRTRSLNRPPKSPTSPLHAPANVMLQKKPQVKLALEQLEAIAADVVDDEAALLVTIKVRCTPDGLQTRGLSSSTPIATLADSPHSFP